MERSRPKDGAEQIENYFVRGSTSMAKGLDYEEQGNGATARTYYVQALGYFAKGLQVPTEHPRAVATRSKIQEHTRTLEEHMRAMPPPVPERAVTLTMSSLPAAPTEPPSLWDRMLGLVNKSSSTSAVTDDWVAMDGAKKQPVSQPQPQQLQQVLPQSFFAPVGPSPKLEKKRASEGPKSAEGKVDGGLPPGVDKETLRRILDAAVDTSPGISWEDVAGLEEAKRALKEAVVLPSLRPDLFSGLRAPASGVLLFGPPGCGKTMLAKAVASAGKCAFFSISASSLMAKFLGESEGLVKGLFAVARHVAPSVIFIDEIDSLLSERSDKEHEASRRVKTEFLVQWDGLPAMSEKRVLVMGATNRPYDLDEAALRRMPQRVYIPLPDKTARLAAIRKLLVSTRHKLSAAELDDVAEASEGYSQSDLKNLCQQAAMEPLRELGNDILTTSKDAVRPVSRRDFETAQKYARPSVDPASLQLCEQFKQRFGMI